MRFLGLAVWVALSVNAQEYTRGLGVYPGDPKEDFGPVLLIDESTYRNLALHRPAYHSSSYDYNLTAQLVTDGIKDTKLPRWVSTSTSRHGVLKKNEREWLLDGNWVTAIDLPGQHEWVQFELGGGDQPFQVDQIDVEGRVLARGEPENWTCTVSGSDDGQKWTVLGSSSDMARPGGDLKGSVQLSTPARYRFYRLQLDDPRATGFQVAEVRFKAGAKQLPVGGPFDFTSAWQPAGKGQEWVYVDLGAACTFDRVVLAWIRRAAEGSIQVSYDASNWKTVQALGAASGAADDIRLPQPVSGRYVRVLMTRHASNDGYVLSELEVYGRGGLLPQPKPAPAPRANGRIDLAAGSWRLQRASLVNGGGNAISQPGFNDEAWIVATVPGTVLSSYYNIGAIPDPNFGDNQLMISDSFFCADFWYRDEFVVPAPGPGKHVWLKLDGINWKADVYFNGEKLGRIDGGFFRARYDISRLLHNGQKNAIAVLIRANAHPGAVKEKTFESPDKNGGVLGTDNPTYHATIGWDWIPTMRGRDIGIWNDVYLTTTGSVTIESPFVRSKLPLPDTSRADVTVGLTLRNHQERAVSGTLRGRFGDITFVNAPITIPAGGEQTISFDPSTVAQLRIQNPRLWWPNGYGNPNLYTVDLAFEAGGHQSDAITFQAGIRQFTYSEEGGALRMWINGRRFIPKGGNWGFGESMLRYRAREYDAAVLYHRDMNFNMIRDWVGQIGDEQFYDACDRHGIVVMQDFWLANPWDGPDPDDDAMFIRNAQDYIRRIRTHPSIGLYCGRNEGYPPKPLDDGIRKALDELHPDVHYVSSSADDVVSGHGPYQAMPLKYYFTDRAPKKFHSEMGMPNIVTMDSLKLMMPESATWPLGRMYGLHDFCLTGAQGGRSFIERIQKSYGTAHNAGDWVALAQFVNYEGYRAMFEAQSKNRMGLLIWMSHPTWPSLVWQTYDYYFDPTAAYFGSKKASEPLHIQWNPATESVEVVNYSGGNVDGLTAKAEVLNMDGTVKWQKTANLDSKEDSTVSPIKMEYPADLSSVHFIRLTLTRASNMVSDNFYWRGTEEGNYQAISQLPKVRVDASTRVTREGSKWVLTTELRNTSSSEPALLVSIRAVREKSGDRVLPALFSDNYVSLMPGERRTITAELEHADTRGENPVIAVSGLNAEAATSSRF